MTREWAAMGRMMCEEKSETQVNREGPVQRDRATE